MFTLLKPAFVPATEINDDLPAAELALAAGMPAWRMLLVEDRVSDVYLAENMMEDSMPDYGWNITDRPSMAKAISALQQSNFDIALVDLGLEDVDGPETISLLRAAAPDLPIVVYSGSSDGELLRSALSNGAQFYIEKGKTDPKLVRAMLRCVLEPTHI